jgi:hypothetical protein
MLLDESHKVLVTFIKIFGFDVEFFESSILPSALLDVVKRPQSHRTNIHMIIFKIFQTITPLNFTRWKSWNHNVIVQEVG